MNKHNQSRSTTSTVPLVAAIITVIYVIAAITLIALERLEIARGRNIEDVPQQPIIVPLILGSLFLVSLGWLVWLIRHHGTKHIVTLVVTGFAAILLVVTPLLSWQAFNSSRDLTVISLTCDAESLRNTGRPALESCEESPVDTIVLLEGVKTRDQWVPERSTGNLTREFTDLPGGNWSSMLTVDGPPETVAVTAIGHRGEEQVRLGGLRPYLDPESGRLRWSGLLPIDDDISTVQVLFYLSANPAVESATIQFEVRECSGQTLRSFDASQCQPMEVTAPVIVERSPEGTRTWRHPLVSREGSEMVIKNLEARTYELQPDYATIELYTQSTDVLVIPSAMPQTFENSITEPGASSFEVKIDESTGELTYTVYLFPTGPTFANFPIRAS